MLFDSAIHFSDEKKLNVDVFTRNNHKICSGDLSLERNSLPRLELPLSIDRKRLEKNTFFHCKHKGRWFTLIGCEIEGFYIYPKIVVNTKRRNGRFTKFGIILQGLSDWMDSGEYADNSIDENLITKSLRQKEFRVTVSDPNKGEMVISSRSPWETSHLPDSCFKIKQYRVIDIQMLDDSLNPDELIEKVYEIKNIFSLLVGHSLNIEYIFDNLQKRNSNSVYFFSFYDESQPITEKHRSVVDSNYLFRSKKWETIVKHYYEYTYKKQKTIWNRLAASLGKTRHWEHNLLSRVSLIDSYSAILSKKKDRKLSRPCFRSLKDKLQKVIINHQDSPDYGANDQLVLSSIQAQLTNNIRNQLLHSFKERLKRAMEFHHSDVVKAINLNQDKINHLIGIRNHIAHGQIPKTKEKNNITYESILTNKALLLLLYWAYRDLGFNDNDIAHFFNDSKHPSIMNARPNKQILDELTRDYPCITVTKADFLKVSKNHHLPNIFEYKKGRKNYLYHFSLSQKVKQEWVLKPPRANSKKFRYLELFLESVIDTKNIKTITYIGTAYIQNENNKFKISSACLFNAPKTINLPFSRFWLFDENKRSWISDDAV